MKELNFTFSKSLMTFLSMLAIALMLPNAISAQNQSDLVIVSNAEVVLPSCLDELDYFYKFTVVDDDPNFPTLSTPTITGLSYPIIVAPYVVDSYDAGGFNYAVYEMGFTISGGNAVDFFDITYENETVEVAIDVTKDTDVDVSVSTTSHAITIPVCEDVYPGANFVFTVTDCDGVDANEVNIAGFGQFDGVVTAFQVQTSLDGTSANFAVLVDGAFDLDIEAGDGNTNFFQIVYKGAPGAILVDAVEQDDPPAVISAQDENITIPVCDDSVYATWSLNVSDLCETPSSANLTVVGLPPGMAPTFSNNPSTNQLFAAYEGFVTAGNYFPVVTYVDGAGNVTQVQPLIIVNEDDEPDFSQLACNPNTNITILEEAPDCGATIIPSMLINSNSLCPEAEAAIYMTATLKEAHHVASPSQPDVEGFGEITVNTPGKYKYTLSVGDDECWGYFTIEDKAAPICDPYGDDDTDLVVCGQDVDVDPSGVDDLATEIVSIMVIEKYGKDAIEPWFDQLDENDFDDCSDLANIEYTTTKETYCGDYDGDIQAPDGWEVCMVFKRTWTAYDWKGHGSEGCSQYVAVVRPTELEFEDKIEVECGVGTAAPVGPYFYDLGAGYTCPDCEDEKVIIGDGETIAKWSAVFTPGIELGLCSDEGENCSNAYKQINEWTWLDVCGHDPITEEQTLISSDKTGPVITPNPVNVWTNPFDCTTSMTASFEKSDACSDVVGSEVTAFYQIVDDHGNVIKTVFERVQGMSITLTDVPLETEVKFEFSAWDCCGNMSMDDITANSWDNRAPVCIANDELEVGLIPVDHEGIHAVGARIYPEDLDDTSKDNCFPLKYEIRKVYADGTLGEWKDYVEYYYDSEDDFNGDKCTDVQWVDLKVTEILKDGSDGLSTVCQSKLILRDSNRPEFVTEPSDYSQDCFAHDYVFTPPTLWGFCLSMDSSDSSKEYHCPTSVDGYDDVIKTVTRTWTVTKMTEHDMFTISTSQTIYVTEVRDEVFTFPYDFKDECTTEFPAAKSLDDILVNEGCSEWVMNVTEERFAGDEGACYKILRTYDFINWCLWDGISEGEYVDKSGADNNNDDKLLAADGDDQVVLETDDYEVETGRFKYLQIIKIIDNSDPTGSVDGVAGCDGSIAGCDQGTVVFTVNYSDVCSTASITDWYINTENNGKGGFTAEAQADGSVKVYKKGLGLGTYTLHVRLDDECGNFVWISGSATVTQSDCKKPTLILVPTVTKVMPETDPKMVAVWLSDVLVSSSDNCPGPYTYAIENARTSDGTMAGAGATTTDANGSISATFVCPEDNGGGVVRVWMRDVQGNVQYVDAPVVLLGGCDGAANAAVAGKITNESDDMIDEVTIEANGSGFTPFAELFDGLFTLDVPMTSDVTVTPTKDLGHLNGVSGADLVALQRHILGIKPLTSAYQMIAADVSGDERVNTVDMLHVTRLILGIYDELPNVDSWRFIDKTYVFADPTSPWEFPESINYADLSGDQQADFIGVKMGDLTGNAIAANILGSDDTKIGDMTMAINDATIKAGQTHTIEFTAKDFNDFTGYQLSIELANGVTFEGAEVGVLPNHSEGNFGLNRLADNVITTNWANADAVNLEDGAVLFSLTVSASTDVNVSEAIKITSTVTAAEAYNSDLETFGIQTQFNRADAKFALYQNTPNPFSAETQIAFELDQAGAASLKIMDVSGRVLKQINGTYTAGYHQITLNKSDLGATGVLYYQLDTDTNSATKKMVILE